MKNDKLKQLSEALASVGYEINQLNDPYENPLRKYSGNIELLLWPESKIPNPFAKEILIKLIEVFSSLEYGLVKYELLHNRRPGEINLILQSL